MVIVMPWCVRLVCTDVGSADCGGLWRTFAKAFSAPSTAAFCDFVRYFSIFAAMLIRLRRPMWFPIPPRALNVLPFLAFGVYFWCVLREFRVRLSAAMTLREVEAFIKGHGGRLTGSRAFGEPHQASDWDFWIPEQRWRGFVAAVKTAGIAFKSEIVGHIVFWTDDDELVECCDFFPRNRTEYRWWKRRYP